MDIARLTGRFVVALLFVATSWLSAQRDDDCPPYVLSPVSSTPWLLKVFPHHLPGTTVDVISGDAAGGGFDRLYGLGRLLVDWTDDEGQRPQPIITWDANAGLPQQEESTLPPDHPPFNQPPFSGEGKKPKEFDDPGDSPPHPVDCQCGVPEELQDVNLKPLPPGVLPPPLMNYVQPTSWGSGHYGVAYHDGAGFFLRTKHTGGSSSESENTREIHFVDGTVNHYEVYTGRYSSANDPRRHWRITHSIDPYDNLTRYHYEGNKLSKVERPDGMDEIYIYDPSWIGGSLWPAYSSSGSGVQYSGIEIRYELRGNPATPIPGKTRRYLYKKRSTVQHGAVTNPDSTAPLNGDLLFRVYYPAGQYLDALSDPVADEVFDLATASTKFEVAEYDYVPGTGLLKGISHLLSDGIETGVETVPTSVVSYDYTAVGGRSRVQTETLHMLGLEFTYIYTLHPPQLGQSAIASATRTSPDAATVVFSMDNRGRVTSIKTLPRTSGVGYADREADSEYDPAHDSQPQTLETVYEYGGPWCNCKGKPTAVVEKPSNRRTEYDYDTVTGLLREVREPNPSGQAGFAVTTFDWEPAVSGELYGRWRLNRRTNAEGEVWEWSYPLEKYRWDFEADEVDLTGGHGTKSEWVVVTSPEVSESTNAPQHYTEASLFNTGDPPVLADLPGSTHPLPRSQGVLVGQLLQTEDADGLVSEFSHDARGRFAGAELNPGGGATSVKTSYDLDDWGGLVATTANATSANPVITTIVRDGRGAPTSMTTMVGGLPHVQRFYYDQWGNTAVVESTNQKSTGGAPDDFHPTSPRAHTARPWLRDEWHYEGARLLVELADRRSLDHHDQGSISDGEDARFLRTDYAWTPDGWLFEVVSANEAKTELEYDGFGSFFRATKKSANGSSVQLTKYFVNNAQEVTRSLDGIGNATIIARNGAGFVTSVANPPTSVASIPDYPAGWQAPHARLEYDTDVLGRTSGVSVFEAGAATPLVTRSIEFDEIGRQFSVTDTDPATGQSHITTSLWSGASTVAKVTYPSGRFVERTYDALRRLHEVRDGMGNPNKSVYAYVPNTPFVASVTRWNWDEVGATPGYVKRPVEYVRDNLGRVLDMRVMPRDPMQPGDPTAALTHSFTYYTSGATESYTDPSGKVEEFLPDALGRLVERFLTGTNPIWNGTRYLDWMQGSNRTAVVQMGGLSDPGRSNPSHPQHLPLNHMTKTVYDFAGRPIITMDPGAGVEPTVANPHQPFARMMRYDAASRMDRLYKSENIEIAFYRDAIGRVLQRRQIWDVSTQLVDLEVVSWLWGRDNFEYDALGRISKTNSHTSLGDEYVAEVFARDVFGRKLGEQFAFQNGLGGPLIVSDYTGGDSFRSGLQILNASPIDDLHIFYTPDAAGRVASIAWGEELSSNPPSIVNLATYAYEGGLIRRRTTNQELGAPGALNPFQFDTDYEYDAYGRMSRIGHEFASSAPVAFEYDSVGNLIKEYYTKQGGQEGDRFAYDEHHRLHKAWLGSDDDHMKTPSGDDQVGTYVKKLTYGLDAAHNRTTLESEEGGVVKQDVYTRDSESNRYASVAGESRVYDQRGNRRQWNNKIARFNALEEMSELYEIVLVPSASSSMLTSTQSTEPPEVHGLVIHDWSAINHARNKISQRLSQVPDIADKACCESTAAARREVISPTAVTPLVDGMSESDVAGYDIVLVQRAWYLYDAFGRRVTRSVTGDGTYFYAWDGWMSAEDIVVRGGGSVELKQFVWGEQLDELVAYRRSMDLGASWENYYIAEGGGHCPSRVLDEAGNVVELQEYDPYGQVIYFDASGNSFSHSQVGSSAAWRMGVYDPESGLYYFRQRYYDPDAGRWTTRDPTGVGGDAVTWMNAYSYGSANPLVQWDPYGLQIVDTDRLLELAAEDGAIGSSEAGKWLEDQVSKGKGPKNEKSYPVNPTMRRGRRNRVVPDFTISMRKISWGKLDIVDKALGCEPPIRIFLDLMWIEVTHGKRPITPSKDKWQFGGMLRALRNHFEATKDAEEEGVVPVLILVTTGDTAVGESMKKMASKEGIILAQMFVEEDPDYERTIPQGGKKSVGAPTRGQVLKGTDPTKPRVRVQNRVTVLNPEVFSKETLTMNLGVFHVESKRNGK